MITTCPICNSVKECEDSFQFKNMDNTHRLECSIYQDFLKLISQKTNLNKDVIDILYLIENLNNIIDIKDVYKILDNFVTKNIPENVAFKQNYEKEIHYIFANFIEINKNYTIRIDGPQLFGFKAIYLTNENMLLHITRTYQPELLCLIEFDIQECMPYDIDLLNNTERQDLQKNIKPYLYKCEHIEGKGYFKKQLIIKKDKDLSIIYQEIEAQIESFKKEVNEEKIKLKEENKKYFERPLLQKEIQEF